MSICTNGGVNWFVIGGLVLGFIADMVLEYHLGKTDKVKASSKLELAICIVRLLVKKILKRGG